MKGNRERERVEECDGGVSGAREREKGCEECDGGTNVARERGRGWWEEEGSGAVGCGRIIVMVMRGGRRKRQRGWSEVGNVRKRHVADVKRTEEVKRQEKYREKRQA